MNLNKTVYKYTLTPNYWQNQL